ncbi:hypothetical protein COBT_003170 [Conglomerata obtusa]
MILPGMSDLGIKAMLEPGRDKRAEINRLREMMIIKAKIAKIKLEYGINKKDIERHKEAISTLAPALTEDYQNKLALMNDKNSQYINELQNLNSRYEKLLEQQKKCIII